MTPTKIGAWSTSLTATFLTDPAVVAAVLPPPLKPPSEPLVKVSISHVDLGGGRPPFGAGTFAVAARHRDTEGFYPLLMPMTTEQSVIGGRETFGEPKKLADVTLDVGEGLDTASTVIGTVSRMGVGIIELGGLLGDELAPPLPANGRLLPEVPAQPERRGLRRRSVARLLHPGHRNPQRQGGRRCIDAARVALRSGG
nr:acetoacetate decarboxylase family protein [Candidatus Microthrix sp.]